MIMEFYQASRKDDEIIGSYILVLGGVSYALSSY